MKTNKTKEPTREPSPGAKENPWVSRGLPLGYQWVNYNDKSVFTPNQESQGRGTKAVRILRYHYFYKTCLADQVCWLKKTHGLSNRLSHRFIGMNKSKKTRCVLGGVIMSSKTVCEAFTRLEENPWGNRGRDR